MGWWQGRSNRDDLIGDGGADAVAAAMQSLATSGEKMSLQELLDGLAHVLKQTPSGLVAPAVGPDLRIEAVPSSASPALVSGDAAPAPRVAHALEGALRAIAADYLDSTLERLPRVSEVLATFAFVLRSDPAHYLRDGDPTEVAELRALARPSGEESRQTR